MPKCPKCGSQVDKPYKKWTMAGRRDKSGKKMTLEIPLYVCPKCKESFRPLLSRKKGYESPMEPPADYESPIKGPITEPDDDEEQGR